MRIKGEPSVWTGDPTFDLIAGVYCQALADARRGDTSAIAWLDTCCPDWRKMNKRKPRKAYRVRSRYKSKKSARYKKPTQTMYKGETCSKLSESPTHPPRSPLSGAPIATSGASPA